MTICFLAVVLIALLLFSNNMFFCFLFFPFVLTYNILAKSRDRRLAPITSDAQSWGGANYCSKGIRACCSFFDGALCDRFY